MRPVPHLIDAGSRIGEIMIVFVTPLFLLRTIHPLLGLAVAIVGTFVYARFTLGKPDGYLVHRAYRAGLPLDGLLDRRIRRFVP
ncbi:MAG TPA: type IV conjugative transfer system protein TraL [Burkholderiaceae bacterium]|nr:type IV conjugative transfer system protein TraL [Burkholderiaceae bacterium]